MMVYSVIERIEIGYRNNINSRKDYMTLMKDDMFIINDGPYLENNLIYERTSVLAKIYRTNSIYGNVNGDISLLSNDYIWDTVDIINPDFKYYKNYTNNYIVNSLRIKDMLELGIIEDVSIIYKRNSFLDDLLNK